MLNSFLPALIVGALLVLFAAAMAWQQWSRRNAAAEADDATRGYLARQLRRRLQISALLLIIGVAIPLGDVLPLFRNDPLAFVCFWGGILGLTAWVGLLAVADLASSRAHFGRAHRRLGQQQRELEAEVARLRRYRTNGHHSDE